MRANGQFTIWHWQQKLCMQAFYKQPAKFATCAHTFLRLLPLQCYCFTSKNLQEHNSESEHPRAAASSFCMYGKWFLALSSFLQLHFCIDHTRRHFSSPRKSLQRLKIVWMSTWNVFKGFLLARNGNIHSYFCRLLLTKWLDCSKLWNPTPWD